LSPDKAAKDFYSATASLIPVLLLTLLLQSRTFALSTAVQLLREEARTQGTPKVVVSTLLGTVLGAVGGFSTTASGLVSHIVIVLLAIGILVVAELAALHPLATGHSADGNPHIVYGALVAGFVVIGLLAVVGGTTKEA
jgi:uncharacterized BrkB/YihY/UPF0761 family membrane protein